MRESIARRAALGTGLLVVGAVTLFAAVQQRHVAGMGSAVAPTVASTSARDPALDAVRDTPVLDGGAPPDRPAGAVSASGDTATPPRGELPPGPHGPDPTVARQRADSAAQALPSSDVLALGERVYAEQRCAACHSIAGVGSPRSPLDGAGSRLTASEIRLWIVDPQAMRPGIRKPAFDDLPSGEVEALVAFIQSLR